MHTLVVVWIEPEHTGKHLLCLPEASEAPHAEAQAVEAPEEGPVLDKPPGKETPEVLTQGEFSDLHPHIVVTDCRIGIVIEREVPEMGVGIEAAEIAARRSMSVRYAFL